MSIGLSMEIKQLERSWKRWESVSSESKKMSPRRTWNLEEKTSEENVSKKKNMSPRRQDLKRKCRQEEEHESKRTRPPKKMSPRRRTWVQEDKTSKENVSKTMEPQQFSNRLKARQSERTQGHLMNLCWAVSSVPWWQTPQFPSAPICSFRGKHNNLRGGPYKRVSVFELPPVFACATGNRHLHTG
jgi:hypothetical protein